MKTTLILGISLLLACAAPAADAVATNVKSSLTGIPAPELPAKAAALVKNVKARERQATTISVVQTAVSINPAAAPAIVGAVASAVPEAAAQAAATAVAAQPGQAAAITRAAAMAAPAKVGKIVAAVCRATPNTYREVAVSAAKAVPGSSKAVLKAVASVLPELKSSIETLLAEYSGNPSVVAVLDKATTTTPTRGPAVGPPYLSLSGTPQSTSPANSTDVTGPRDYTLP